MRAGARPLLGLAALLISACLSLPSAAGEPKLAGKLSTNGGKIGGRDRSFLLYMPPNVKPGAPLLLVIHGGNQEGRDVRYATGFEFDMLADKYGFVVVYPDGINESWNACRRSPQRAPRNVDDVGFLQAIIAHQATVNHIDTKRVFVTGHSMGGAMSYRLALEHPELVAAVAVISSSLPSPGDMACVAKNVPVPMMIINGTADPVNPYRGGSSNARMAGNDPVGGSMGGMGGALGGGMMGNGMNGMDEHRTPSLSALVSSRGPVMSTEATAQYWAKVNGQDGLPETAHLPHANANDPTSVDVMSWTQAGKPPVILYSIVGGGHVVPQPYFRYPAIVGRQTEDLDAPAVIWDFFSRQPSRP